MIDFTSRADLSEWMDEPCSYEDFRDCLRDLAQVNRITFGYRPTLNWLRTIFPKDGSTLHIVDVGCGGGDMLREIERMAAQEGFSVRLTGIDLNPHAARAAREMTPSSSSIQWITGDAFHYEPAVPIDVVICSLFTHHLPDSEIVSFLQWMEQVSRRGWFVNDLHRERLPYFGFMLLAKAMRWHRFVQHDGPISFRRAFRHADWRTYIDCAGLSNQDVVLLTARPARLCVARVKS
jgi:2-polyprenyl-3-methyl-5-hydroxy-6-metoxy-1,4-benzoquinol methylase